MCSQLQRYITSNITCLGELIQTDGTTTTVATGGAFLFKLVAGDFVAQATVADYAGLSVRRVPGNNDGGLMVRVPKVEDAGPGEDLVQLNFFPKRNGLQKQKLFSRMTVMIRATPW